MQLKSVAYPIFLAIELLRLIVLLMATSAAIRDSLIWYAAMPMFCVTPVLWFMLAFNEGTFALWLPMIALVKALSVVSFVAFALRALPDALAFGIYGAGTPVSTLPTAGLLILVDAFLGVYAYGRYRILCK